MTHEIKAYEIEENYSALIENIAGYVKCRLEDEDPLEEIIHEEIDTAYIYTVDRAIALAHYYMENANSYEPIDWNEVWEMVFNDVYNEVKGGENE